MKSSGREGRSHNREFSSGTQIYLIVFCVRCHDGNIMELQTMSIRALPYRIRLSSITFFGGFLFHFEYRGTSSTFFKLVVHSWMDPAGSKF